MHARIQEIISWGGDVEDILFAGEVAEVEAEVRVLFFNFSWIIRPLSRPAHEM